MSKNLISNKDEVNLAELLQIIYKGKWKILLIILITIILLFSYQSKKLDDFTAVTNIKPISASEVNKYISYNNLVRDVNIAFQKYGIDKDINQFNEVTDVEKKIDEKIKDFEKKLVEKKLVEKNNDRIILEKVTEERLLNLFFDYLNEKTIFEDAIRKFNLVDKTKYKNDLAYNESVIRLASTIQLYLPDKNTNTINGITLGSLTKSYHNIRFQYNDYKKWKKVLQYVGENTNKLVNKTIKDEFEGKLLILKNYKKNKVENLKAIKKYELEDLSIKIQNMIDDYDRETFDRLEFLKEQLKLAKKLNIPKNTLEIQNFPAQSTILSPLQTGLNAPYYLRGYEIIDGEIKLLESRTNKKAFIHGLFELEKMKREIEQNKNTERIEKDKTIKQIELAFKSSYIADKKNFYSASLDVSATKLIKFNKMKLLILSILIGSIFGVIYIFVVNSFQSHRTNRKLNT